MRRPVVALAVLAVATAGVLPAQAAKAKPKPVTGSYPLTLYPDPSPNATDADCGVLPMSIDKHPFTVPAAGKLEIDLVSKDATPSASPVHNDWDLYVLDNAGNTLDSAFTEFASEHTSTKFKKRTPVVIRVCNITGQTSGKVSFRFTYS
jgi:hypothetical protein